MSANEFDTIGRRLYDEEAEPPKAGWAKIKAELAATPNSGRIVSLRKYGWMLFVVLIPVSVYYTKLQDGANLLNAGGSVLNGVTLNQTVEDKVRNNVISEVKEHKTRIIDFYNASDVQPEAQVVGSDNETLIEIDATDSVATLIEISPVATIGLEQTILDREKTEVVSTITESSEQLDFETMENKYTPFETHVEESDVEGDFDSLKMAYKQRNETEKYIPRWKISASIMPQYSSNNFTPVDNDDILVTNINKQGKLSRDGYGVFVGIGKSITRSLYIDMQLSFVKSQQDVWFSYATGKIDTLIAEQGPDGSYRVKPVYETVDRNLSTSFSYGGVRIGGTYYFLQSHAGRFNINSSIGVDVLMSQRTLENINGEWRPISAGGVNKLNCSLMISGGYSINLSRGWEASINPVFRFNLSKSKKSSMPYSSDQQSVGLNIGLAKTINVKS